MNSNKIQHAITTNTLIGVNIQEGKCARNDVVLIACVLSTVSAQDPLSNDCKNFKKTHKSKLDFLNNKVFPTHGVAENTS